MRLAVFLCALLWALLVLGTNVAANMIPLGSDCAMLFPRYMNMVRGQVLGLFFSVGYLSMAIYQSAAVFTKFLSGYGLFMGGLTGIMTADYYLVRGNVFLQHLYSSPRGNAHYNYFHGWNVQAYVAYIAGFAVGIGGFAGNLGANVSAQTREVGYIGWVMSFTVSIVVYVALCTI